MSCNNKSPIASKPHRIQKAEITVALLRLYWLF